jgi:HSP20 family protein
MDIDIRKLINQLNKMTEELDSVDNIEDLDGDFEQPKSFQDLFNNSPLFNMDDFDSKASVHELLYDVTEEDEDVVVVVDLPGFSEEQISLQSDERQIRIDAESTDDMRRESVSHTFRLPAEVIPEEASATFENGVLTVTLPKVEEDEQTKIDIS